MTTPGNLFAELWLRIEPKAAQVLAKPWHGKLASEHSDLLELLLSEENEDVPQPVSDYLLGQPVPFACVVTNLDERAFVVMGALDDAASLIHPAFDKRLAAHTHRVCGMLLIMKQRRMMDGVFGGSAQGIVLPKGNLEERKRPDETTFSGADLAHQFRFLSHVRRPTNGKTLKVIAPSPTKFLSNSTLSGRVGVAPIAEHREDLEFHVAQRLGTPYLDAQPGGVDLHARIEKAVKVLLDEGVGLILFPELVVPAGSPQRLSDHLKSAGKGLSSLVVAGSGLSNEVSPDTQRPYNEATLMTSEGLVLGIQRKLHPFNMGAKRMKDCCISPAASCDDRSHLEDVTGGEELVILDLSGLGRVMVLICEDLEQQTPCGDIALGMRPDWILTPVLDVGLDPGRWTHGRGMEIGRRTWSRIVVSNSGILGARHIETDASRIGRPNNTAICLDPAGENRVKFVSHAGTGAPETSVVVWEPASWQVYRVAEAI